MFGPLHPESEERADAVDRGGDRRVLDEPDTCRRIARAGDQVVGGLFLGRSVAFPTLRGRPQPGDRVRRRRDDQFVHLAELEGAASWLEADTGQTVRAELAQQLFNVLAIGLR